MAVFEWYSEMNKLTSNKAQCPKCNEIIESKHVHDFKWCKCRNLAVDGGLDYTRRIGDVRNYIELSEYENDSNV